MLVLTGSGELPPLLAENREEEQLPARLFSWAGNTLPSKMHILQLLNVLAYTPILARMEGCNRKPCAEQDF